MPSRWFRRLFATRDAGFEERLIAYDNCEFGTGRLCSLTDAHQALSFKYAPYGEMTEQRNQIGSTIYTHAFEHDRYGRLTGISYPGGVRADYVWGPGRPKSMTVTINGQTQTLITDASRRWFPDDGLNVLVDEQIYPNDRFRRVFLDRNGRVAGIESDPKQGLGYQYDADSRINRIENIPTGDIQSFAYDGVNRLTTANGSATGPAGFQYDANHNRRERTGAGFTETLTLSATSSRLDSITGPLPRQYSYRPTGEVASIFGAADRISESSFELPLRAATLSYDRFNRLKQVTGQNLIANYKVSANDRRVEKSVRGVTTQFVYAQNGQTLYERDLETSRSSQHLYFQGQLIGLVRNGLLYRLQADHLGRPEALVTNDANSTTVWRAELRAFNRQVINNQIGGYNLGFPGQYHDEETGFIYNNFRDYDPATGRYLQPDPIGLRGGVNPYGYVGANPVSAVDPLGLQSRFDTWLSSYPMSSDTSTLVRAGYEDAMEAFGLGVKTVAADIPFCTMSCGLDATIGITPSSFLQNRAEDAGFKAFELGSKRIIGDVTRACMSSAVERAGAKLIGKVTPGVQVASFGKDLYDFGSCAMKCY